MTTTDQRSEAREKTDCYKIIEALSGMVLQPPIEITQIEFIPREFVVQRIYKIRAATYRMESELRRLAEENERLKAQAVLDVWNLVSEGNPPEDVPVWLAQGDRVWIGTFNQEPEGWVFTNCYNSQFWTDEKWDCNEAEFDDDYAPTHWKHLPTPPSAMLNAAPHPAAPTQVETQRKTDARPKRDTVNPCAICGWSEHMAIHSIPHQHGGHSYRSAQSTPPMEPGQKTGINGLTEAETNASASVMGLVNRNREGS